MSHVLHVYIKHNYLILLVHVHFIAGMYLYSLQDGDDVDAANSGIITPYNIIIQAGRPTAIVQFFLIVEKQVFIEVDRFLDALVALVAIYYVFNIVYPPACGNILHFLEKKLFDTKSSAKFPPSVHRRVSDIEQTV